MGDAEETVEEKLKQQRLNVGFSRAEELVWFVHSKPIEAYKGTIAKALQHYANLLEKGEVKPEQTDPNSPMERSVLDWLQKSPFYQAHRDSIEILPQFPIGQYLRQLDPTYQHPAWRVDFLLTFVTEKGSARIVIEYDGFEHHFQKGKNVNVGNHDRYLLEADIERQLTLESYGYRFLRINRFNLGKDPAQTLSEKLEAMVERLLEDRRSGSVDEMQQMASGLAAKELKNCSRCGAVKPMEAFFDKTLKSRGWWAWPGVPGVQGGGRGEEDGRSEALISSLGAALVTSIILTLVTILASGTNVGRRHLQAKPKQGTDLLHAQEGRGTLSRDR
ncbi:MAG: hypothetical protein WDM92_16750 [Caulobacteraceae bacterium]